MAEPTAYDEIQDGRLDSLESLISAEYEPPAGAQYSYPVASQGITQDQWQQMNLTTGDGAIITDGSAYPFRLVGHDSDSETNQRNTLILKVADTTGRNEASMAGFYFRQTEDIELPFPPVTSTTTYHVTVTYDPRKFKTEPLRLEVWAGEPPRAYGQQHILLHTVARTPNQLLSQAARTMHRHYVSPVITAAHDVGLPDSKDVLYGTLGIVRSRTSGGDVVPGTGAIYEARGSYGWHNLLMGKTEPLQIQTGNGWQGNGQIRRKHDGFDVTFNVGQQNPSSPTNSMFRLPGDLKLSTVFYTTVFTTDGPRNFTVGADTFGHFGRLANTTSTPSYTRGNFFIPNYYL